MGDGAQLDEGNPILGMQGATVPKTVNLQEDETLFP
jgi:hypothetical protein